MSEVAGRLEIPVESSTKGFGERLRRAIEAETRGIAAKIEVEVEKAGLRRAIQDAVDEAATGVKAKIGVNVDTDGLKAKLEAAAKAAGTNAKVNVVIDNVEQAVEQAKAKAEAVAKDRRRWWKLPFRSDDDRQVTDAVKSTVTRAQAVVNANPIKLKIGSSGGKKGGGFDLPDWLKPSGNARSLFMPTAFLGIASLIQPAIAAIGGSIGGLVAMVSSAATSLNVLGGAGGAIGTLISSMTVLQLSFGGLFGKLSKVPEDLMPIRKEFEKLRPEMEKFTKVVRGSFWNEWKDDIVSTGKVAMPIFRDGLAIVGKELGETARQTASWMRSPMFKTQMSSIFKTMLSTTDGLGDAFLGMAKGMVNITVAAGPMLSKFGDVMRNFGKWAEGIGDTTAEQGRLAAGFDNAWRKASQLWDMTKDLGASLKEMFGAGKQSGDNLLTTLQENLKVFREWTESTEGQRRMQEWFESVEPIARAAGRLIVGLGAAIARLAEDSHTAALLDKITNELLPSLETFLANLGGTLGPQVVEFITNVLTILTQMSAAGSPLGQGLKAINVFLTSVKDLLVTFPQLASNLGVLLGAFLAFRSLTFFTGIIPPIVKFLGLANSGGWKTLGAATVLLAGFSGAMAGLPKPIQTAALAMAGWLLLREKLNVAGKTRFGGDLIAGFKLVGDAAVNSGGRVGKFRDNLSGLTGALGYGGGAGLRGGLKGALGGLKSVASGVMGLFGGPWGIAIAAAAAGVSMWSENQEKAKAIGDALTGTIDKQTGAFTDASRATVKQALLGDLSTEDIKRMQDLGVNFDTLADAVIKGGPHLATARAQLDGLRNTDWLFLKDDADIINGLQDSVTRGVDGVERSKIMFDKTGAAAEGATTKVLTYAEIQDSLATATDRARQAQQDLAAVLLGISNAEVAADQAQSRYNQTLSEANKNLGHYKVTVDKATGALDLSSQAGRDNQGVLQGLRDDAIANWEAMLRNGEGADAAGGAMKRARESFVKIASQMLGGNVKAANEMADRYGYTADTVDNLSDSIDEVPKSKAVELKVETMAALAGVALSKFAVGSFKGKTVDLKAVNFASAVAAAAQRSINSIDNKTVTITAIFQTRGAAAALHASQAIRNSKAYYGIANGGILERFADGGIRGFGKRPEDHVAQIAPAGSYRLWAEDETGGEAYIPLGANKRPRSMAILDDVANRFGMALTPLIDGASGGARQLSSSGAAPSASRAASSSVPRVINFHEGAIKIDNPAPEPASRSVVSTLRSVGDFGLFGEDD